MTGKLPPDEQAKLDALYRERNGDPQALASERYRPIPTTSTRRPMTTETPRDYSAQQGQLTRWVRRDHPSWLPDLYTLRDGEAHVIIERTRPTYALALCGRSGHPNLASNLSAPCRVCSSFRPRS